MKKTLLSLLALVFALSAIAQNKVYFVDDATETGEPIGHATTWAVPPGEKALVNVLYTNNKKIITDKQLLMKVEKKNDMGLYELAEEFVVDTDEGQSWAFFAAEFPSLGSFKVTIQSAAQKDLAVEYIELIEATTEVIDEITDEHAKGFKLTICEDIDEDGNPVNVKTDFKLTGGKAMVMLHIAHKDNMKANRFTIKISKKGENAIDTFDINVEPESPEIYYEHEFTKAGTYTITITAPSGKTIGTGTITVK